MKLRSGQPNLSIHAKCDNSFGSYKCECYAGYTGDGKECTLLDMCKDSNTCAANADCSTTVDEETHEANATCACKTGYQGNGYYCLDINECLLTDTCDDQAACENSQGSYTCTCKEHWDGDGKGK